MFSFPKFEDEPDEVGMDDFQNSQTNPARVLNRIPLREFQKTRSGSIQTFLPNFHSRLSPKHYRNMNIDV
jgi:hypothetical protein